MNYYGNPMTRLIEELAALPGIGGKSAQRLAFHIINLPREKVAALSEAILAAKDEVKYCSVCCNLTEEEICPVCAPFTPNESGQRSPPTCYRGCWHVVSRCLFNG